MTEALVLDKAAFSAVLNAECKVAKLPDNDKDKEKVASELTNALSTKTSKKNSYSKKNVKLE